MHVGSSSLGLYRREKSPARNLAKIMGTTVEEVQSSVQMVYMPMEITARAENYWLVSSVQKASSFVIGLAI